MPKAINIDGSTVSARDDAFLYHVLSGISGIYDYGNRMAHTVISSNLVRIRDGIAQVQGRNYIIYPSEVVDMVIENGSQGNKRNDIIVLEFKRSSSKEEINIKVVKGAVTTGTVIDPVIIQEDTLSSGTTFQFPLYRVKLDGINISAVDDLRKYVPSLAKAIQIVSETDEYMEVDYILK